MYANEKINIKKEWHPATKHFRNIQKSVPVAVSGISNFNCRFLSCVAWCVNLLLSLPSGCSPCWPCTGLTWPGRSWRPSRRRTRTPPSPSSLRWGLEREIEVRAVEVNNMLIGNVNPKSCVCFFQCFGSGLDPDSIRLVDPYPYSESVTGSRRAKMTHKNRKKI